MMGYDDFVAYNFTIFILYYNSKGNKNRMKGAMNSFIASLGMIQLWSFLAVYFNREIPNPYQSLSEN